MRQDYPPATATVQEDNELVRVVRWHFPPGTATGWHRHERDYVVVPTISGTLTMIDAEGNQTRYSPTASESYFRRCGAEHDVVNLSDSTVEFVEIELKKDEA
ncbi:cupin domain-containing protein [Consotaella aegiceratis]|uniref:cupin domain-containing protein n=1 Tax=Consotaella aegiceratis TaxID=3097961 RepID=UPI002F408AA2